jgi:NhaA family Na+:H+ antiporter
VPTTLTPELPPGASPAASKLAQAVLSPIARFLRIEAAAGVVLLAATIAALVWANSPWAASYRALWHTQVHIAAAGSSVDVSLQFVVNDVLMTIFFFVVGLEIKRELSVGELSDVRRAALPIFAALGGMIVPAAIYLAFNRGDTARGWGVPMATDIAFAAGVMTLIGARVRPSMRVFLLALAIIDDIGAIVVIALYYSGALHADGLLVAALGLGAVVTLQKLGARHPVVYIAPAAVVWIGVFRTGVHPTIAGVLIGLMTPAVAWFSHERLVATIRSNLDEIGDDAPRAHELAGAVDHAHRESRSPAERLESRLHGWVAFAIMPLFALANAGVDLGGVDLGATPTVALGIALGLIVGKPLGVIAASALAVRLRVASLPEGLTWRGVAVVGSVAGIGFTMALFVATLAFADTPEVHAAAKVVVLASSTIAAIAAVIFARRVLPRP